MSRPYPKPNTNKRIHQLIEKGEPVSLRCATKVIDRLLYRKHLRAYLTIEPVELLEQLLMKGGGPHCVFTKGGRALYPINELIEWVETRLVPKLKAHKERAA